MNNTPDNSSLIADITYTVNTGEKLINETFTTGGDARLNTGIYEQRRVSIQNGRVSRTPLSLEVTGFQLADHRSAVTNFLDPAQLESIYYPEVVDLVKRQTGASRALVFDHTLRSGNDSERDAQRLREVILSAHNDYTEWSGPQRVRDILPEEAEDLLSRRFAIVQVWRPIDRPVVAHPLALVHAQSVVPNDMIVAERRFPNRVGEIYRLCFSPEHRWFYFPNLQKDEAIIFKVYDSEKDGRARFTPHTAFVDPTTPDDAPPRQSIEVRSLVFF